MMIALNTRLLDEKYPIIVNLLTDSVDLLGQSLKRFRESGLNPSPKQYNELPKPKQLRGQDWIVFCKKNPRDLEKLIEKLRLESGIIVIDNEADYASPNGKVNKDDRTKINGLISQLTGKNGKYIGVTATPARLDLNNTFANESEMWVDFKPHPKYVGQDFFFPRSGRCEYRLHPFADDEGNEKAEIQKAIMHFLCGVAQLHNLGQEQNFTMLVHTSGKRIEHDEAVEQIQKTLATLSKHDEREFENMRKNYGASLMNMEMRMKSAYSYFKT